MSEFIRLRANGVDAYPDASTENTYRPNGTSVESALVNLESNVTTLGGVAGEAKTLAEQNSVKIATAEQEISDINSSLKNIDFSWKPVSNITDIPETSNECLFIFKDDIGSCASIVVPYDTLPLGLVYTILSFYVDSTTTGYVDVTINKDNISINPANYIKSCELYKCYYR